MYMCLCGSIRAGSDWSQPSSLVCKVFSAIRALLCLWLLLTLTLPVRTYLCVQSICALCLWTHRVCNILGWMTSCQIKAFALNPCCQRRNVDFSLSVLCSLAWIAFRWALFCQRNHCSTRIPLSPLCVSLPITENLIINSLSKLVCFLSATL